LRPERPRLRAGPLPALLLAAAASAILVLGVRGTSARLDQSYHGLHHTAYVVQIGEGIVPPTNPSSLGGDPNFYWAWHALLAGVATAFHCTPFEANRAVNIAALAALLFLLWTASGRLTRKPLLRLAVVALPFVLGNPLGTLLFWARLGEVAGSALLGAGELTEEVTRELLRSDVRVHAAAPAAARRLLPVDLPLEVPMDPRAGGLIHKFFNFSSFPAAIPLFVAGLLALRPQAGRRVLRCAALVGLAAALTAVSPIPAAALGAAAVAASGVQILGRGRRALRPEARRALARDLAPPVAVALGAGLLLPYVLEISRAYGASARLILAPGELLDHARFVGWALVPALPGYLLGLAWFRRLAPLCRFHLLAALGLGAAGILFSLPPEDPNEYKLVILSSLPGSLVLVGVGRIALERWCPAPRRRARLAGAAAGLVLLGAAAAIGAEGLLYRASPWARQEPYVYSGRTLDLLAPHPGPRRDLQEAYAWLRENTPPDAFVLQEPVGVNALELSAVARRRVVAATPSVFTKEIPFHPRLARLSRRIARRLAGCRLAPAELRALASIPAPWPPEIFALASPGRGRGPSPETCRRRLPPGIELVHHNPSHRIFRIALPGRQEPPASGSPPAPGLP